MEVATERVPSDVPAPHQDMEEQTIKSVHEITSEIQRSSSPQPAAGVEAAASSLFAISKPINPGLSLFGTTSTVPLETNVDIADQVRFGFSHIPQSITSSVAQQQQQQQQRPVVQDNHINPAFSAQHPPPAKFADMESYIDAAEEEMETAEEHGESPMPPTTETFERAALEMRTQSPHYNEAEGGHYDANALVDGTRVGLGEPSLHSDATRPDMVPEGFRSYGPSDKAQEKIVSIDDADDGPVGPAEDESRNWPEEVQEEQVQDDRLSDNNEAGVGEDGDGEYDEYGDPIEEGDYDQRVYNVPDDDDERLSNELEEAEEEAVERYGDEEVYSEDEGPEYDENEYGEDDFEQGGYENEVYEGSDGSYESEEDYEQQSYGAATATASKEPVVINLLSDSEDDDDAHEEEEAAPPHQQVTSHERPHEEATQEDHLEEAETEETPVPSSPVAEAAAEMAPHEETNDQILDEGGIESSENQTRDANGGLVYSEDNSHETSQPEAPTRTDRDIDSAPNEGESPLATKIGDGQLEKGETEAADDHGPRSDVQAEVTEEWEGSDLDADADADEDLDDELLELEEGEDSEEELLENHEDVSFETAPEGAVEQPEIADEEQPGIDDEEQPELVDEEQPEIDDEERLEIVHDDVDIIELVDGEEVDEEVGGPANIVDDDEAVGTPMEVEEGSISSKVDREMRDASAEPARDIESAMEVIAPEREDLGVVYTESTNPVTKPISEDVEMSDIPLSGPDASSEAQPTTVDLGLEKEEGDGIADSPEPMDDDYEETAESQLILEHEQRTQVSVVETHQVVSVEISVDLPLVDRSTEVVTQGEHEPEQFATGPFSPPLTQPAELELEESLSGYDPSTTGSQFLSNKNSRPLPLLTPTQSHVTTHPASQLSALEENVGNDAGGPVNAPSPTDNSSFFSRPQPDSLRSADDETEAAEGDASDIAADGTEGVLEEAQSEADLGEMVDGPSAAGVPSPTLSAIGGHSVQAPKLSDSGDREVVPVEDDAQLEPDALSEGDTQETREAPLAVEEDSSPSPEQNQVTDSTQTPKHSKSRSVQEEITVSSPYSEDPAEGQKQSQDTEAGLPGTQSSSPDLSVRLARQSVAAKRSKRGAGPAEPLRVSPRVTRARSSSFQMSQASEADEDPSISFARSSLASPSKFASQMSQTSEADEDPSISLARASLASPSKVTTELSPAPSEVPVVASTTALKTELTKGLRKLRECVSLKNIRNHVDKHLNVVAIVASKPTTPTRAKGGPREYMMSFNITDPSIAPVHVAEVQFYRPHKDSLPIVKPGDAVLLRGFQVRSISKKGWGLRTAMESAWAVYEEVTDEKISEEYGGQEPPPQIRGPPVEDYDAFGPYMSTLKAWYRSLDSASQGKLEKAVKKFEEVGVSSSNQSSQK